MDSVQNTLQLSFDTLPFLRFHDNAQRQLLLLTHGRSDDCETARSTRQNYKLREQENEKESNCIKSSQLYTSCYINE